MTLDERRAELIDAAVRVIARDGLATATTRAIVAEAGMPQGALFYAFASRDALIDAVIEHITDQERVTALLGVALAAPAATLADVLTTAMDGYLRMLETDPAREMALLEVATHAIRHNPEAVHAQWVTYRSAVADGLRYLAEVMSLRWTMPVHELAHTVTATLDGLTLSWLTDRDSVAARRNIGVFAAAFAALAEPVPSAEESTLTPQPPSEEPPCRNHPTPAGLSRGADSSAAPRPREPSVWERSPPDRPPPPRAADISSAQARPTSPG
ncbi:MAG: TetR family transcriptional regulator [Gordonia sp. (in: high G+C Gram-positive bacteria)]